MALPTVIGAALLAGATFERTFLWPSLVVGAAGLAKGFYLFLKPVETVKQALDERFFMADEKTLKRRGVFISLWGSR